MRQLAYSLQNGPLSHALGFAASIVQTVRRASLNVITRDRDGDWYNRQKSGTFVAPRYSSVSYEEVEKRVRDWWCHKRNISPGDVFVDVGAGVGNDIVVISKLVGPRGRVIAIEAQPRTFRCLQKTIAANGLQNVSAVNLAVSDRAHDVIISDDAHHLGNRIGVTEGLTVEAQTLDAILRGLGASSPTVVKINIEGAETAAIRGAPETLLAAQHWCVCCHDFIADRDGIESMRTSTDVLRLLDDAGLQTYYGREDHRPWVRNFVYATRPQSSRSR